MRGVTGTVSELMAAFGVQVCESTVRMRRCKYGWPWEKCLLYKGYRPPLRPDNPNPIIRDGDVLTHWQMASEAIEQRYDCSVREVLITLVALGYSIDQIKAAVNLKLTPQHYRGLLYRVGVIRDDANKILEVDDE